MPHPELVTQDDDQFINQQNEIAEAMQGIQKALAANDVMICAECEGPIEQERKDALPSAITCIECAQYLSAEEARQGKLMAKPGRASPTLPPGWSA